VPDAVPGAVAPVAAGAVDVPGFVAAFLGGSSWSSADFTCGARGSFGRIRRNSRKPLIALALSFAPCAATAMLNQDTASFGVSAVIFLYTASAFVEAAVASVCRGVVWS
jgi:hypothetical protein